MTLLARPSGTRAIVILATAFVLSVTGCRSKDCSDTIKEDLPPGSTLQSATAKLMQCGFTVQINAKLNALNASKTEKGLIIKRVDVVIQMDANDRVLNVEVKNQFTGP